jgi:hypothetical protein
MNKFEEHIAGAKAPGKNLQAHLLALGRYTGRGYSSWTARKVN